MTQTQRYLVWPGAEELTASQKRWLVSNENPNNPLRSFVGNKSTVDRLRRLAFQAMGRESHRANDLSFALLGPAGVGKTTIAKGFSRLIGLPFVEIDSKVARSTQDIFDAINGELSKSIYKHGDGTPVDLTLCPIPGTESEFMAPPLLVFIDECHNLVNAVQQGLLTATEPTSHKMETSDGVKLDTRLICWILATTDRGLLFDAFDTRFAKFTLKPYSREEMALIVQGQHPGVPLEVCSLAAKYAGRVSREAIQFMTEVKLYKDFYDCGWIEAVEKTRVEMGIDEHGMDRQRLMVLKTLGQGPSSLAGLAQSIGVKIEELVKYVLPPLREYREGHPPLISVSHRHFITSAGLAELEKRKMPHRGKDALPKNAA